MARRHGPTPGHRPGQRIGLPIIPRPPEWTRRAVCTPEQADRLFYADPADPDETDPDIAAARQAEAQAVCAACPMRAECAMEMRAVDQLHGRHGVWAGITPAERKPRKPAAARKPNSTNAAIAARAAADPRGPIPQLPEVAFDNDVARLADQGVARSEIAVRPNRSLRDVDLARERSNARRWRAARRNRQRHTMTANAEVAA